MSTLYVQGIFESQDLKNPSIRRLIIYAMDMRHDVVCLHGRRHQESINSLVETIFHPAHLSFDENLDGQST